MTDWCQMNTSYLEKKQQPYFQNDTDILFSLMDFKGLWTMLSTERSIKLSTLEKKIGFQAGPVLKFHVAVLC